MNPLTQIKNTQKATQREIVEGISEKASWHARYKHSAYIFSGGLPYELTEGDLLAVFSQYGEIVDVNLVRDKKTGKSKGFAFLAYMDQRSTVLAVDNLSGAKVGGRVIRVEHVDNYKKKKAEVTGEPESESEGDEEGGGRAAVPGGVDAARWGHEGFREQEAGREPPGGGAAAGMPGDEPWAKSDSVFALLMQAKQQGLGELPPKGDGRGGGSGRAEQADDRSGKEGKEKKKKHKKEKKEKREKKEKKHKRRSSSPGSDSRGGGRSLSPRRPAAGAAVAGQGGDEREPQPAAERYGPPRPLPSGIEREGGERRERPSRRGDREVGRGRSRSRSRSPRTVAQRRRSGSPRGRDGRREDEGRRCGGGSRRSRSRSPGGYRRRSRSR